jgi:outer membrane phospholipase A
MTLWSVSMNEHTTIVLALVLLVGVGCQRLAWRVKLPAIQFIAKRAFADAMKRIILLFVLLFPAIAIGAAEDAQRSSETGASLDDFFTLYQPYVANISAYEPICFLVGSDPKDSKFQISFKYRFFDARHPLGRRYPWLQGLNFGYTQTSYWDLKAESAPFEDTNYKPELFYISDNLKPEFANTKGLFLQAGVKHESNGHDGDDSRSTNTAYVKPIWILYNPANRLGIQLSPKLSTYFGNEDENNRDLPAYRGYFEIQATAGWAEGLVVVASIHLAQKGASLVADATYPLHRLWSIAAGVYLQMQYADTLAENLLDYEKRTQALRFGFAIVR